MNEQLFTIDAYRAGDEAGLLCLFEEIFQKKQDAALWRWQNRDNPRGESLFALLRENGKIRGQLCLQAARIKAGDRCLLAGQRIASMLESSYRGTGAFGRMFEHLLAQAQDRGISFIYGFPNQPSLRALNKIRTSVVVAQIPRFVKFFSGRQAAQAAGLGSIPSAAAGALLQMPLWLRGRPQPADPCVRPLDHFDTHFDQLWEQAGARLAVATVRDSAYLNWRYLRSPADYQVFRREENGLLRGYIVLLPGEKQVHIMDLLALEPRADLPGLLTRAEAVARAADLPLSCWCLDDGTVSRILRRRGFLRLQTQNNLVITDICCPPELFRPLSAADNWYLTMGDSDYA